MTLPVLINPGGGSAGNDAADRVRAALDRAGIAAAIELVPGPKLAARATELAAGGARIIVAAGGDGTLSTVGGALAGTDCALGILPLGTLNHLARDLGISFDLDQAAAILVAGHRRRIDVAEVNGRSFVNNSAIGLYPLMVADRDGQQQRLGRSKKAAMLIAGLRTLITFHHHRLSLTINDGEHAMIDTPLLFVGNNIYRRTMPRTGYRDRLDDGRLSVTVARKAGRLGLARAMLASLFGRSSPDQLIELDNVTSLRVASRRSHLTVSCDGETVQLAPPLDYRIRPKALLVIGPASSLTPAASRVRARRASSTASRRSPTRSARRSPQG